MKKLLFAFLALFALSAEGQSYPQRPIRMIVPFAAGGTTDALGRVLAVFMSDRLGQQVVIENRPGGGGTLGAEVAARSQPDGYTLLLGSAEAFGMTEGMRQRLAYSPERDLVPVAMVARSPNIFIVHPSVPVKSVAELIEFSKSKNVRYPERGDRAVVTRAAGHFAQPGVLEASHRHRPGAHRAAARRSLRPQHPRRGGALEGAFHHGGSKGRVMLKLDIFPHIFPQPYFERMKQIAEGNPALAAQLKRWMHIPVLWDLDKRMRMMKRVPEYNQILTLSMPAIEIIGGPDE